MSREYPCVYFDDGKCRKDPPEENYVDWCVMGPCSHETRSNGDRYRAMSDEEMAEALSEVDVCPTRADRTLCGDREGCKRCWLDYLRSPEDKETNDDKELAAISAILENGKCPFPKKVCPKHYLCSRCIEETLKNTADERRVSV